MFGFYLVMSLLSRFSLGHQQPNFVANPLELNIAIEELHGVGLQTPILLKGKTMGYVNRIEVADTTAHNPKYRLWFELLPENSQGMTSDTLGIVTSLKCETCTSKGKAIIELLQNSEETSGAAIQNGVTLKGFSSYAQFWG